MFITGSRIFEFIVDSADNLIYFIYTASKGIHKMNMDGTNVTTIISIDDGDIFTITFAIDVEQR